MAKKPTFIKPCRTEAALYPLTVERIINNSSCNVETSVILDLNILIKMQNVISGKSSLETEQLVEIISFFNLASIYISPGFALSEADIQYVKTLRDDYEKFMGRYCPTYINSPNCTNKINTINKNRQFESLALKEQNILALMYTAMLAIQIIEFENSDSSPEEKFRLYIELMQREADIISAIEAEVAKYWFFDRKKVTNNNFKLACKIIRDNFNKGGKGNGRLQYTLNYARDLAYYRFTAMMDSYKLDGAKQDTWLLTADQALVEIAKSIYFFPKEGESTKYVALFRNEEQQHSNYWNFCDNYISQIIEKRKISNKCNGRKTLEMLSICQKKLEQKILHYWADK